MHTNTEYDSYCGYLVASYTTLTYDPRLEATVHRLIEVINLGRQVRHIAPVIEPDEEPWEPEPPKVDKRDGIAAAAAKKAYAAARHDAVQEQICAYLREHGPTSAVVLAPLCGKSYEFVRDHLTMREGKVYQRIQVNKRDVVWALVEN